MTNGPVTATNGAVVELTHTRLGYVHVGRTFQLVSGEWPGMQEMLAIADGWEPKPGATVPTGRNYAPFGGRAGNPWTDTKREYIVHTD